MTDGERTHLLFAKFIPFHFLCFGCAVPRDILIWESWSQGDRIIWKQDWAEFPLICFCIYLLWILREYLASFKDVKLSSSKGHGQNDFSDTETGFLVHFIQG